MTIPNNSMKAPFGRVYATQPQVRSEHWALGEHEAIEGIQRGDLKPSLTTILTYSRVLVASNSKVQHPDCQKSYLQDIKQIEQENAFSAGQSPDAPFKVGDAVHEISERAILLRNRGVIRDPLDIMEDVMRNKWGITMKDHTIIRQYGLSLKNSGVLEQPLHSEETISTSRWVGTADLVAPASILDLKTASKNLGSAKSGILQVVALARAFKKSSAGLVVLNQNGSSVKIMTHQGDILWERASRLINEAESLFYERVGLGRDFIPPSPQIAFSEPPF